MGYFINGFQCTALGLWWLIWLSTTSPTEFVSLYYREDILGLRQRSAKSRRAIYWADSCRSSSLPGSGQRHGWNWGWTASQIMCYQSPRCARGLRYRKWPFGMVSEVFWRTCTWMDPDSPVKLLLLMALVPALSREWGSSWRSDSPNGASTFIAISAGSASASLAAPSLSSTRAICP